MFIYHIFLSEKITVHSGVTYRQARVGAKVDYIIYFTFFFNVLNM